MPSGTVNLLSLVLVASIAPGIWSALLFSTTIPTLDSELPTQLVLIDSMTGMIVRSRSNPLGNYGLSSGYYNSSTKMIYGIMSPNEYRGGPQYLVRIRLADLALVSRLVISNKTVLVNYMPMAHDSTTNEDYAFYFPSELPLAPKGVVGKLQWDSATFSVIQAVSVSDYQAIAFDFKRKMAYLNDFVFQRFGPGTFYLTSVNLVTGKTSPGIALKCPQYGFKRAIIRNSAFLGLSSDGSVVSIDLNGGRCILAGNFSVQNVDYQATQGTTDEAQTRFFAFFSLFENGSYWTITEIDITTMTLTNKVVVPGFFKLSGLIYIAPSAPSGELSLVQ